MLAADTTKRKDAVLFMMGFTVFKPALLRHQWLTVALLLAIALSLIGANWGRVEDWNMDQVAARNLQPNGLPKSYLKPPLHTYLNRYIVVKPAEWAVAAFRAHEKLRYPLILWGTRLLTIALFCGSVVLIYLLCLISCGPRSAALISLLTATSAGLLVFNHYGTADSPLLFWMLGSFAFAVRAALSKKLRDAFLAGLLAGLATADKYNGLGVAAAIPVALLVYRGWKPLFGIQSWIALLAIPLGFFLGNPGALFDREKFVQDFLYNLYTTPVYAGEIHKTGYLSFLKSFQDLIGVPASMLLIAGAVASLYLLLKKRLSRRELALMAAAGAVFVFYFITIGKFPRMETRFVLPVIPFALLFAAPACERINWRRPMPTAVIILLLTYNVACSIHMGLRFLSDPRMDAQLFAMRTFPSGAVVEGTYCPNWNRLPGLDVTNTYLDCPTGHQERFAKIFGDNAVIKKGNTEHSDPLEKFTVASLKERNPDYVVFNSQLKHITSDPQVLKYFSDLESGRSGYDIVFNGQALPRPKFRWNYPKNIDFLVDQMVVLKRSAPQAVPPR